MSEKKKKNILKTLTGAMGAKEEKIAKPTSAAPHMFLRILLWSILIFLLLRGIISIFTVDSIDKQREKTEQFMLQTTAEELSKARTMAFAESFIQEYYTNSGESDDEYQKRVKAYLASGVNVQNPGKTKTKVLQVNAVNATYATDSIINVDIMAMVEYPKRTKLLEMMIPIEIQGDACAVVGLPQLIPQSGTLDVYAYAAEIQGSVSKSKKDEIEEVLDSFFKTFFAGNASELSYYITDTFPYKKGLDGIVEYDSIDTLRIGTGDEAESGEYHVQANIITVDEGRKLPQTYYLKIEQSDRLYVTYLSTVLK